MYYVGGTPEWEITRTTMCNAAPVLIYPVDEYPNGEAEAFCAAITNAGSGQAVSVMMAAHYT